MNINGTKTAQNLMKAFAGESQAKNRYTFYAKVAMTEGFVGIARVFEQTAINEQEHAKIFFKHLVEKGLEGQTVEIEASYPVGLSSSTLQNLEYAANGEQEEWESLYPAFAEVARQEGFADVAHSFLVISKVEQDHEKRYRELHESVKKNHVFERDVVVTWQCDKCGYHHESTKAPLECPVCKHDQKHFQTYVLTY